MYEKLIYSSTKVEKDDIFCVENRIGSKLPNSYVRFCQTYNGAKLRDAQISIAEDNQYEVRSFTPVDTLGVSNVEFWDDNFVAFANDSGGNFFVFKKPDLDAVYFWDHETDNLEFLCSTFEEFLTLIKKWDDEIEVPKNAEVWVNPAFLKKQRDLGNA